MQKQTTFAVAFASVAALLLVLFYFFVQRKRSNKTTIVNMREPKVTMKAPLQVNGSTAVVTLIINGTTRQVQLDTGSGYLAGSLWLASADKSCNVPCAGQSKSIAYEAGRSNTVLKPVKLGNYCVTAESGVLPAAAPMSVVWGTTPTYKQSACYSAFEQLLNLTGQSSVFVRVDFLRGEFVFNDSNPPETSSIVAECVSQRELWNAGMKQTQAHIVIRGNQQGTYYILDTGAPENMLLQNEREIGPFQISGKSLSVNSMPVPIMGGRAGIIGLPTLANYSFVYKMTRSGDDDGQWEPSKIYVIF